MDHAAMHTAGDPQNLDDQCQTRPQVIYSSPLSEDHSTVNCPNNITHCNFKQFNSFISVWIYRKGSETI